jgi:hypothetical protein
MLRDVDLDCNTFALSRAPRQNDRVCTAAGSVVRKSIESGKRSAAYACSAVVEVLRLSHLA